MTLIMAGKYADARTHLEQVVALVPNHPLSRVSLAWVLFRLNRVEESAAEARRALELAPNLAPAHHRLANALEELGDKAGATQSYRRALELEPSADTVDSSLLMLMLNDPSVDARGFYDEARNFAKLHAEPLRAHQRPHANDKSPERRLRIGYVSPDFRAHAVQQFVVPLLPSHDAAAVEIFLYASVEQPDAETEWYRSFAGERYRDIARLDDAQAGELIRKDGIDVLVDLANHGAGHRLLLFARKPAPVQVTWLGYAATTGLDCFDCRLTDPYFDPPGTDLSVYSEPSLHLPEAYWCYSALNEDLAVGPLPAERAGFITFGNLNSFRKVHPAVLRLWARVMREIPESRLALLAEEAPRKGALATLADAGIASERVLFEGRVSRHKYLERHQTVDIVLDSYPFAGGTTSLDAVWMGVPIVTLRGDPTLQRAGVTILSNLGLPELVAASEDEFVEKAVSLARDRARLAKLRAELRARFEASPFADAKRFARNLEAAYRTVWRQYCAR
jgi:predicted O-linked N-acetylglucosamine transferase (SPINDLY family)